MLLTLYSSNYGGKFMLFLNDNTILLSKIWLLRVLERFFVIDFFTVLYYFNGREIFLS